MMTGQDRGPPKNASMWFLILFGRPRRQVLGEAEGDEDQDQASPARRGNVLSWQNAFFIRVPRRELCWQNALFSFCSNFRSACFVLACVFPACAPVHFQIFSFCPNVCSSFSVLRSDSQNVRSANPGEHAARAVRAVGEDNDTGKVSLPSGYTNKTVVNTSKYFPPSRILERNSNIYLVKLLFFIGCARRELV